MNTDILLTQRLAQWIAEIHADGRPAAIYTSQLATIWENEEPWDAPPYLRQVSAMCEKHRWQFTYGPWKRSVEISPDAVEQSHPG